MQNVIGVDRFTYSVSKHFDVVHIINFYILLEFFSEETCCVHLLQSVVFCDEKECLMLSLNADCYKVQNISASMDKVCRYVRYFRLIQC